MDSESLAEFVDKLDQPPYKGILKDYEFEEAVRRFLHRNYAELFSREVQLDEAV